MTIGKSIALIRLSRPVLTSQYVIPACYLDPTFVELPQRGAVGIVSSKILLKLTEAL